MFNRLVGCEDNEDCARLTGAEPHAKETSHRAPAIIYVGPTPTVYASSKPMFGPRKVPHGLNACGSLIGATVVPASRFDRHDLPPSLNGLSDPNSALPFEHPTLDHVMGPSVSTWRLARSSRPRSCNTSASARRANRCATDPSRANATRAERSARRQKAGENQRPDRNPILALAKIFLPSQQVGIYYLFQQGFLERLTDLTFGGSLGNNGKGAR